MAKLAYLCDYCRSEANESLEEILIHEKTCDYNPENKSCGTCKNLTFSYGNEECKLKGTYEYFDERKPCPSHELCPLIKKNES